MKICLDCGLPKNESEFQKNCQQKDRLRSYCKPCQAKRKLKYNSEHRDEAKEFSSQWRKDNPDKLYHKTHPEQAQAYTRKYQQEHPDKVRANNQRRRARIANAPGSHTDRDIELIYQNQNGLCAYCGCELNGTFDLDHIHPLSRGGSNNPDNLACSCRSCNRSKHDKTLQEWVGA